MHAWPAPDVPDLPGTGLPLRLHDTATGQVRPTAPGPTARMYVCGITPYDATHIGHAATYVTFDLVHRAWLDAGPRRALRAERHRRRRPAARAGRCATARTGRRWPTARPTLFREDMTSARRAARRATTSARSSRSPTWWRRSARLREQGAAYDVDGDTYFSVHSDPRFGGVGNLDDETMLALFARARRRPGAAGQEAPARLPALAGGPAGRAVLGHRRPRAAGRPAGLARRVRGDRAAATSATASTCRAAARPGVPAPRDERVRGAGADRQLAVRPPLRARRAWSGSTARRCRSRRATSSSSRRCAATVTTRWRCGWRCSPTTTAATGPGPPTTSSRPRPGWPAGGTRCPGRPGPPADGVLADVRRHLADDLDAPAALAAVDRWAAEAVTRGGPDDAAPDLVRRTADALLGVRL